MSRVGNKPIPVPKDVKVKLDDRTVTVEGKLGTLRYDIRPEVDVEIAGDPHEVRVSRKQNDRTGRSVHGLTRALLRNMIDGVQKGFEKKLEIVGVGYGAFLQGNVLQLRVGYANEVHKTIPTGLEVKCPDQTHVVVRGCDKQLVGQFAAEVRAVRKPEPYKGKGVRYEGEHVKIKPGKTAT